MDHMKCSCCCCNSILLKLQSLLSSPLKSSSICEKLEKYAAGNNFPGDESIKLLCYPAAGKVSEAVELIVQNYPSIMLQYAKDVFQNRKEEWRALLVYLCETLRENLYEQWNKDTYLDALKGTLLKLARLYKPVEFLSLLPRDGSSRFLLPFIQECYQMHSSIYLRKDILHEYQATAS